jgi:hypothetical protein
VHERGQVQRALGGEVVDELAGHLPDGHHRAEQQPRDLRLLHGKAHQEDLDAEEREQRGAEGNPEGYAQPREHHETSSGS